MTKQITNKYAGECAICGGHVGAGNGIAYQAWSNEDDDMRWVVKHADAKTCAAVTTEIERESAIHNAALFIISCVKDLGKRSNKIHDGEQTLIDLRKGYNAVGWLLTRTGNTLYLTSRNNLDGYDTSETYTYTLPDWHMNNLLENLTVRGGTFPYQYNF